VVITTSSGCSDEITVSVSLLDLPAIATSNNGPVCEGGTLELAASGGTTYSWSGPNNFTSDTSNPTINNVSTLSNGAYTVVVTDANGCSNSSTFDVIVNPKPMVSAVSNTPVCKGSTILLSATGGITYQWTGPNGFTSDQQAPQIPAAETANAGTYTVVVTDANGCTNSNSTTVSIIDCTGSDEAAGYLQIMPNPSADLVIIQSDAVIESVRITGIDGRIVFNTETPATNTYTISLQQLQLAAGIYIAEIKTAKQTFISKLVKE
jgi:hypothetical protein